MYKLLFLAAVCSAACYDRVKNNPVPNDYIDHCIVATILTAQRAEPYDKCYTYEMLYQVNDLISTVLQNANTADKIEVRTRALSNMVEIRNITQRICV